MKVFTDQHQQMIDLAESVLATARETGVGAMQRLTAARLALARAVSGHVGEEIAFLNDRGRSARLAAPMLGRYHDELLAWRQALMTVNHAWPPQRIQSDSAGFVRVFAPIVCSLRERVRWEEEELYPQLRAAG